jgi:predicted GNAT family N-acyltransferase
LGLEFSKEELEAEVADLHIVLEEAGHVVACLVLSPKSETQIKMRQVAVEETLRGQGIGAEMVRFSEKVAREHGFTEMVLNARENVVPFYKKLGYVVEGERFMEVTIPHFSMRKRLKKES